MLPGEIVDTSAGSPVILTPSPNRIEPRCIHFGDCGDCGGCQYQHADYPTQLALKQQILEEILALAGLENLPSIRAHSAADWEYRNRIRLRVQAPAAGIQLGYSRRATNEFLPIRMCPIAAPLLWRAASALMELAADPAIRRWLASAAEVELFCSGDESRLQIMFLLGDAEIARREPAIFPHLCDRLRQQVPQLTGAGAILDPELNRRVRRNARRKARWDGAAWGADGLTYEAAGRSYWVSRGAFFQVNRFLVDRLVTLVTGPSLVVIPEGNLLLPLSGDLAWDLFAGVGLFTRALADRFTHIVAVEAGDIAAANLATVAKAKPTIEAVRATTLDFLRTRELQRERPDLIVLDPPRAGLGLEASEILTRIAAPRIVYVSCDPTTLARDLAVLTRSIYRIESIDLIDLFPQTFHMETVVHLSKLI